MSRTFLSMVAACAAYLAAGPSCYATIHITSVNRGISVNGVVSADSSTGDFNAALQTDFGYGTVSAVMDSTVKDAQFRVDASADESTEWGGPLNEIESAIFFEVGFTLEAPFAVTLTGTLAGSTESEHYILDASLVGPDVDIAYDVWNEVRVLNEARTLKPGVYQYSLYAHPSVLGGLDGGWAAVYLSEIVLSLTPVPDGASVPEPSAIAASALAALFGVGSFGRRLRCRTG